MIDVTLLICTRNRSTSLERTLHSITRAAPQAGSIEVVLVDNGSTDDTPARIAGWRSAQTFPVTLVDEPHAGLARARNAGLARARGRIVAMTDDDCVLDPGYFTWLIARFAQMPTPVIVGGRILLGDPADLPITIKVEDHPMVADARGFPGGFVMGANLAFTRDVIDRIGIFDVRFGAGAPFVAAEDTDLLFRALGAGIPVHYDPHVVVEHHHGRRAPHALHALLAGYAFGDGALYAKHLFRDSRVVIAIIDDIGKAIADLRGAAQPFPSIRFFHGFRLRALAKGFLAYVRASARPRTGSVRTDYACAPVAHRESSIPS